MKAKDLAEILMKYPDANVAVGFEEHVQYSELTSGTEDVQEDLEAIFIDGNDIVLAANHYMQADKIWPEVIDNNG